MVAQFSTGILAHFSISIYRHEGIIASNFAMMMRQEDFRKLFEEENDPLRANALSYDFAGEPMFTQYSF